MLYQRLQLPNGVVPMNLCRACAFLNCADHLIVGDTLAVSAEDRLPNLENCRHEIQGVHH